MWTQEKAAQCRVKGAEDGRRLRCAAQGRRPIGATHRRLGQCPTCRQARRSVDNKWMHLVETSANKWLLGRALVKGPSADYCVEPRGCKRSGWSLKASNLY